MAEICDKLTIDSNSTGLRFAKEVCIGELDTDVNNVVWMPREPNSYGDFGGTVSTTARNPINAGRQNQKGVVTDLDASGEFNSDVTQKNMQELLPGFFFAQYRTKGDTLKDEVPVKSVTANTVTFANRKAASAVPNAANQGTGYVVGEVITVTDGAADTEIQLTVLTVGGSGEVVDLEVTVEGRAEVDLAADTATTTSGIGTGLNVDVTYANVRTYVTGDIIFLENFAEEANNIRVDVVSATDTEITVTQTLIAEVAPVADSRVTRVGRKFAVADTAIVANVSAYPQIAFTAADITDISEMVVPGEEIFIGGDTVVSTFADTIVNADGMTVKTNRGYARVRAVDATLKTITLDKTQNSYVASAGAGLEIEIYFGRVLKNEADPTLIVRETYQLERLLGTPDATKPDEIQSQYLIGSVPSEIRFQYSTADKVTVDLNFTSTDSEERAAVLKPKDGSRPAIEAADAFNTTSDLARVKMSILEPNTSNPTPLFAYLTEFDFGINNNTSPNKAIGVLGAFEVTTGQFAVTGSATAYFSDIAAVQAVRNNADVTFSYSMFKNNSGISFDIPLIALGDGKVNVEQDAPITIPLELNAAADRTFNHTLLATIYPYLPDAAGQKLSA